MTKIQSKYSKYGQKLKSTRISRNLSKPAVAQKLQISSSQVAAIENGSPKAWEGTYSRGYVEAYRRLLDLKKFELEDLSEPGKVKDLTPLSERSFIVSKLFSGGLISIGVLAVIGYVFWQVLSLTSAPPLRLDSPSEDTVTSDTKINISGKTSENTDVSINGQSILTEPDGRFSAQIPLKPGLNELTITATNRLTKQQTINRTVVADYQIDSIEKR